MTIEANKLRENQARRITLAMEADISDRDALGNAWEDIDFDTQETIRKEWRALILAELTRIPETTPDALMGILANAVQAQGGRCLICGNDPALYCGLDCAKRGR